MLDQEIVKSKQDELAQLISDNRTILISAFYFEKRRRGIHQQQLLQGIKAMDTLREACLLMVKCLETDENREDFCQTMIKSLK